MPIAEDFKDDPPTPMGDSIVSRCNIHPESHGQNYKEHLQKEHRPDPEVFKDG